MELRKLGCFVQNVVIFILVVLLRAEAEEFHGRHVCTQQQTVSHLDPVQQTYRRAVFRNDLQRVTYQTAFRTMFRIQIHATIVSRCCPGWEKLSPRDTSCNKPVCSEECENGGQCVGPGLCLCAEGYTGYRCQIDIDECSGRNKCQQKCKNIPGSYQCSCQQGFRLADDEYSCELCLNCTTEFKNLQAQMESVQANSKQNETIQEIKRHIQNLTEIKVNSDRIHEIENKINELSDIALQDDRYQELQKQVNSLQNKVKEVDSIKSISRELNSLRESSQHKETFQEIHKQIENLQEVKEHIESIKTLNETIHRMKEEDTQTRKLNDIQYQIDSVVVAKAKQDEAQAIELQQIRKELEQLQSFKSQMETFKDIKAQIDQMADRIQELELDKAALKTNLTTAVTQYEAAISALQAKGMATEQTVTLDPYEIDPTLPLDRLASLSQQISMLEEKMADCGCNQDYPRG